MSNTYFTRDTKMAACLCTLGVPMRSEDPIVDVRKDSERIVHYFFEQKSADGVWTFEGVAKDWNNQDLHKEDPENPINYIKFALYNRERLLDLINKAQPLGMVQRGDSFALVSLNASEKTKKAIFKML